MSTFNNAIPQPTDQLSQSQPQILANFASSNALYGYDHVAWTNMVSSANGQHLKVTFSAPLSTDPNLASTIASLYTKTAAGATQLFYQNGNMASNVTQLTGSLIVQTGNDGFSGTYQIFQTPWGIRIFTGTTQSFSGSRNFTLSNTQTFGGTVYCSIATPYGSGGIGTSFLITPSSKNFNIQTAALCPVTWFAITSTP